MGEKKLIYGIFCFVSGVLFASIVMFCVVTVPKADADSGMNCMRNNLNAWGYSNKIPSPTIDIAYEIPGCIKSYGYTIDNVGIYNGMVRVTYKMPSTSFGTGMQSMGVDDAGSGGIKPF